MASVLVTMLYPLTSSVVLMSLLIRYDTIVSKYVRIIIRRYNYNGLNSHESTKSYPVGQGVLLQVKYTEDSSKAD